MFTREFPSFSSSPLPLPDNAQNPTTKLGPQGRFGRCLQSEFPSFFSLVCTSKHPTEQRTLVAHLCYRQAWFVLSFPHSTARLLADFLRPSRLVFHSICRFAAASEVSSILESRISGTSVGGNVEETGRVLSAPVFMPWPFIILLTIFFRCW